MRPLSPHAGRVVEAYARKWLAATEAGQNMIRDKGEDAAIDAFFELLNAGFIKLKSSKRGIVGLMLRRIPQPPKTTITRPPKAA